MCKLRTKATAIIIGSTGTISKSFRKYLNNIPGKHGIQKLQKTAISGTAHILVLRKVLMKSTEDLSWEIALHGPYIVTAG